MSSRSFALLFQMINDGEITVGEARRELDAPLPSDARELLATWVLDRADQGDSWAAGDPEVLLCGCRVSYDREQVDVECGTDRCVCPRVMMPVMT